MATSVPFAALRAPKDNPRRAYDKKAIEGLAQSIKKDGVLQNLIVRPEGDDAYRIVAGKRRYLALKVLKERGEIDDAYRVPIRFPKKTAKADLDRVATVENVQREPLDPIDEAESFARLLTKGVKVEDISAETGVSVPTIRRRLALANLAREVKEAVRAKALPLSLAEALTLAPPAEQKGLLRAVKRYGRIDARQLRNHILGEKPSLATAIFPVEKYKGSFTKDLFAEKETTYFDDREQFMALQKGAVDMQAEALRKEFAWVEVATDHSVSWWQYREAKGKEPRGAIIHLAPSGRVEVRKGLVKHEVDAKAARPERTKEKPKERPTYSRATVRYANAHKTLTVQAALMGNPRKAKETAVMLLLGAKSAVAGVSLKAHEALRELPRRGAESNALATIEKTAQVGLRSLGIEHRATPEKPNWERLLDTQPSPSKLLPVVRVLDEGALDRLLSLLLILCFGMRSLEHVEPSDSLFSGLVADLALDMRAVWTPDAVFLSGLSRDDLMKAANECGATRKHPGLGKATKKELVATLTSYFKRTADSKATLDESDAKGRAWLPVCMHLAATGTAKPAAAA